MDVAHLNKPGMFLPKKGSRRSRIKSGGSVVDLQYPSLSIIGAKFFEQGAFPDFSRARIRLHRLKPPLLILLRVSAFKIRLLRPMAVVLDVRREAYVQIFQIAYALGSRGRGHNLRISLNRQEGENRGDSNCHQNFCQTKRRTRRLSQRRS